MQLSNNYVKIKITKASMQRSSWDNYPKPMLYVYAPKFSSGTSNHDYYSGTVSRVYDENNTNLIPNCTWGFQYVDSNTANPEGYGIRCSITAGIYVYIEDFIITYTYPNYN